MKIKIAGFMKMNISASAYKFQQFFSYKNQIIYQLDDTETGVIYDIDRDSLYFHRGGRRNRLVYFVVRTYQGLFLRGGR